MAWSAPMTAVSGAVFTASQYNMYVRDNLLETLVSKVTSAGQYGATTGINQIDKRAVASASVGSSETTTSTTFTDLTTGGPAVQVECSDRAIVQVASNMATSSNDSAVIMGFAVTGASTVAASDSYSVSRDGLPSGSTEQVQYAASFLVTGLTPGTNVFTAKYRVGSGTGTYLDRYILVVPF